MAPAILATVQTANKLVDVLVVHMGNDKDDLDRRLQAQTLRDIMKNRFDSIFLRTVLKKFIKIDFSMLQSQLSLLIRNWVISIWRKIFYLFRNISRRFVSSQRAKVFCSKVMTRGVKINEFCIDTRILSYYILSRTFEYDFHQHPHENFSYPMKSNIRFFWFLLERWNIIILFENRIQIRWIISNFWTKNLFNFYLFVSEHLPQ